MDKQRNSHASEYTAHACDHKNVICQMTVIWTNIETHMQVMPPSSFRAVPTHCEYLGGWVYAQTDQSKLDNYCPPPAEYLNPLFLDVISHCCSIAANGKIGRWAVGNERVTKLLIAQSKRPW